MTISDAEARRMCALLEKQLSWLRLLRQELQSGLDALVNLDLEAFQKHIATQEGICTQLRFLDRQSRTNNLVVSKAGEDPSAAGSDSLGRLHTLEQELDATKKELGQLNRTYAALIKRSRRTTNLRMSLLAQCANTYAPLVCWQQAQWTAVGY